VRVGCADAPATNILIDRLGMARVNALLGSLGLTSTKLRRRMIDFAAAREGRENVSSPRDLARLLEAAHRGKLFARKATTDEFFRLLSLPKDSPMTRGIPDGVRVASKPGDLGGVRAECGVVHAHRAFVLCAMTTLAADGRAAERAITAIAAVAYRTFDRLGRSSIYGRLLD
jgi:beta-lactamase class A